MCRLRPLIFFRHQTPFAHKQTLFLRFESQLKRNLDFGCVLRLHGFFVLRDRLVLPIVRFVWLGCKMSLRSYSLGIL
jgi:hypothetical protein